MFPTESGLWGLWKSEVFICGQKSPIFMNVWICHSRYPVEHDFLREGSVSCTWEVSATPLQVTARTVRHRVVL